MADVADRGLGRLSWADCAPSSVALRRTGVREKAVIRSPTRNTLHRPWPKFRVCNSLARTGRGTTSRPRTREEAGPPTSVAGLTSALPYGLVAQPLKSLAKASALIDLQIAGLAALAVEPVERSVVRSSVIPVGEIVLVLVAAQVLERQADERQGRSANQVPPAGRVWLFRRGASTSQRSGRGLMRKASRARASKNCPPVRGLFYQSLRSGWSTAYEAVCHVHLTVRALGAHSGN
jgi:hypothetical protein